MDKKLKIFTIFAFTKAWLIYILCLVSLEISHASPIEFWLAGQESFNQKEECSIYPVCFCQTIDPSDTLRLDIKDSSDSTNYFAIYLDDGTIWRNYTFAPTGLGDHHQYALIIGATNGSGDWDSVIDRKLIFKIYSTLPSILLHPNTSWAYYPSVDPFDSTTSTTIIKNSMVASHTYGIYQNCNISTGDTPPNFLLGLKITNLLSGTVNVTVAYYTANGGTSVSSSTRTFTTDRDNSFVFSFPPTTGNGTIFVIFINNLSSSGPSITITLPFRGTQGIPLVNPNVLAFSDCVEITSNQDFVCTKLISYSNSTDIAGLDFPNWSPQSIYYLRIPAVFFEEQFPQEQEDLELSTDEVITLWSKMEAKKLLDIGFMPFYMHKKLQLILMMDYISIDGIEYRKRDEYQITTGASKRHALRRAQVLLSEKDFITRNLL